jgi:VanZ family protein
MIGYGLLALSLWWWFAREGLFVNAALVAAWSFSVLYASSDEFHQSFVAGRHASWVDVVIDAVGAAIFLTVLKASSQQKNDR